MYRQLEQVQKAMNELQDHIRSGILADDTRQMTTYAGSAQALANQMTVDLQNGLRLGDSFGEPKVERTFVEAALRSLEMAVNDAQRVGAATDVTGIRSALILFKTHVDFSEAYMRAALGVDAS